MRHKMKLRKQRPTTWIFWVLGCAMAAASESRHPVISKVEVIFSLVSHHCHTWDRVQFYNSYGEPRGNTEYVVPHLVYDPLVTLYNPYDESLTLNRARIRIWDPPVGFAFKKNGEYLRPEFAAGEFHGLARFQFQNEDNAAARKTMTFVLSMPEGSFRPGGPVVLQPGESRTFSAWVEPNWTWGLETSSGYIPRCFWDWSKGYDVTNRDGRTDNPFGVEALPTGEIRLGFDPRAGFQTDVLASAASRPPSTYYSFETARDWKKSWVAIRQDDLVGVEAKAMRTHSAPGGSDFQVDYLGGEEIDSDSNLIQSFHGSLFGASPSISSEVISRTFVVGDLLQAPTDLWVAGKTPFASIAMVAKAGALRANRFYGDAQAGTDLYEVRFLELTGFIDEGRFFSLVTPPRAAWRSSAVPAAETASSSIFSERRILSVTRGGRFAGLPRLKTASQTT